MAASYPPLTVLEDYSSSDRDDPSSTEQSDKSTSSSEEEDEDEDNDPTTDENDISSVEDESDVVISVEEDDDVRQATGNNEDEAVSDSILILRPSNERPNISFELARNSSIADKLPGFLTQIRAANEVLEAEKSAGTLANRRIELDEGDSAIEGEEHIEMNLGLGVLEEKGDDASAASESEASNDDGDRRIMNRLMGCKRKQGLVDGDEVSKKKAKIQEL